MVDDSCPPPSYQDVIEEESRVKKTKTIHFYFRAYFIVINVVCSGLAIFVLFLIRYTRVIPVHKLNVTLYCNDPSYNINPIPTQDNAFSWFLVLSLGAIISIVGLIRFKMANLTSEILTKKVTMELWAFTSHLIFMFLATELIKMATGIPYPYYFANKDLKSYYCEPHDDTLSLARPLKLLDDSYRTSFPSNRAAIYTFCITYLYLYLDHYDILIGLHTTQQYAIIVLGIYTGHLMIQYAENGENHKMDLVVGLIIGILHALVAIRNTFGTVVYKRIHLSKVAFNKFYDVSLNAPSNMHELQPLRQNQTDTDVSTMDNLACPTSNNTNNEQRYNFLRSIPENVNPISEQVVPDATE